MLSSCLFSIILAVPKKTGAVSVRRLEKTDRGGFSIFAFLVERVEGSDDGLLEALSRMDLLDERDKEDLLIAFLLKSP